MPRFDPDRIRKMVSSIREAVKQLSDLAGFGENEFLRDPHKISSAKYNFIVAIEAAIDIGNHKDAEAFVSLKQKQDAAVF